MASIARATASRETSDSMQSADAQAEASRVHMTQSEACMEGQNLVDHSGPNLQENPN